MIQQITDESNTSFAQKCSSVTAVMNGNISGKNIHTVNVISQSKIHCTLYSVQRKYHVKVNLNIYNIVGSVN